MSSHLNSNPNVNCDGAVASSSSIPNEIQIRGQRGATGSSSSSTRISYSSRIYCGGCPKHFETKEQLDKHIKAKSSTSTCRAWHQEVYLPERQARLAADMHERRLRRQARRQNEPELEGGQLDGGQTSLSSKYIVLAGTL